MSDYSAIWRQMPSNKWLTAKEIGVAPATMTAMVRRNMVEASNTSPRKYRRLMTPNVVLEFLLSYLPCEFAGIYSEGEEIGMLCTVKNGRVFDCWGEPYDISTAIKVRLGKRWFNLKTGTEIIK